MLLVLLPVTAIILLGYLFHDRKQKVHYVEDDAIAVLSIIGTIACSIALAVSGTASIIAGCGYHDKGHVDLLNSRHVILAELISKDPVTHNKGMDDAVVYNQTVKAGKERLNNIWTNWLTDRIWADAEYIEINESEYVILEESEVTTSD